MKTVGVLAALLLTPVVLHGAPVGAVGPAPVVAYQTPKGIVTSDVDGKNATLRVPGAVEPLVSADGRRMAFARIDPATKKFFWYVSTINGTGITRIGDGLPSLGLPSWSPDATRLVMSDGVRLFIVQVATGAVAAIPGTNGERSPQWSPDGMLIAAEATNGVDQVLHRPDGTSRVVRPNTVTGSWSPDGRHMLQISPSSNALFAVDVLTGARQSLGFLRESFSYVGTAWAPSAAGTLSAYLSVDSWLPWDPGTTTVYRFDAVEGDPSPTPGSVATIASPATNPSAGGYSVTDSNGTPSGVAMGATTVTPSYVRVAWTRPAATPDFAGVEIRYALGDTPPTSLDSGFDGGRLLTDNTVLGPFGPDQHVAISVFSRDWSGHVGPAATTTAVLPHAAAVSLSVRAVPFDVVAGQRSTVTVTATLDYDHTPVPGVAVAVGRRSWPTTNPFIPLTTLHTDVHGVATFAQIPSQSYEYRFVYAGDADHAARTAVARIRVARRVLLTADHTTGASGSPAHLTIATAPVLANGSTSLQRFTTRFVDVGPHNTDTRGTVVFTVPFPKHGVSVQYRVRVPGVNGYIDGYSRVVTLTGA